jgi:PAS domain S-box-containing protein
MRISLKLSQQGLILVGVPIGLMLIFLVSLFLLLWRVEEQAKEADRSKTIIARANSLVKEYYDAASQLLISKYRRDERSHSRRLAEQLAQTKKSFNTLRSLLRDDPEGFAMLMDLEASAKVGMGLLQRFESHLRGVEPLSRLEIGILYLKFDAAGGDFAERLQRLIDYETALHRVSSAEEERARALVKSWIIAGAISAVAIGTILAVLFIRNTTSRLAVLMNNTVRLSQKQPLLPVVGGEDEIARLDGFFHKMAEELEEAARKERAILDNAVDVICSINADGFFTAANPASLHVWGYDPGKLVGMHYCDVIAGDDVPRFREALDQIRRDKLPATLEVRVIALNKKEVHALWSVRWSESEQSLFCVAHDISDRKEVEQMKQDFVAMVSHELRTPLTSLQATLTFLLEGLYGQLSESGQKRVKGAESGIARLINLINDLLDIEKMEAGKLSMKFADVNLAEVIERSVEAVQGFAEQQQVTLGIEKQDVQVRADADRMVQVLVNLLSNAIKFSEDGGRVEIKISDHNESLEVQVIDHGVGIPEGYERTIFDKYGQAHAPAGKRRRGTGLGLPICKAIVEQHGGTIGVTSTEGGGSTFWFRLPHVSPAVTAAN